MTPTIEWFSVFILNYPLFQYLIIFFGAAFGGEVALFALGFLVAQGVLPIFPLMVFSFLGTLSSDILWFTLGRTVAFGKIISHRYAHATVSVIARAVDRVSGGNRLVALIFAKFLVGTRILLIMYVSKNNLELKRFVRYDAIAIILWLLVVIPIGFVSGLGFIYLSHILKNIYAGIGFVILVLLIIALTQIWLKKVFIQKEGEIIKKS